MFDFEKLDAYTQARSTVKQVLFFLFQQNHHLDPYLVDQLKRAAISITLNLAEGTGRMSKGDKRHFYTIARGSVYECVALLQILLDQQRIEQEFYDEMYGSFEKLSKMLLGMIRAL
jgi:four helix bundle protein